MLLCSFNSKELTNVAASSCPRTSLTPSRLHARPWGPATPPTGTTRTPGRGPNPIQCTCCVSLLGSKRPVFVSFSCQVTSSWSSSSMSSVSWTGEPRTQHRVMPAGEDSTAFNQSVAESHPGKRHGPNHHTLDTKDECYMNYPVFLLNFINAVTYKMGETFSQLSLHT